MKNPLRIVVIIALFYTSILCFYPTATSQTNIYMGREIAQTMHFSGAEWLIRASRQREEASGDVMKQLNLKPGMMVGDVGSGNGYYSIKIAKEIREEGKVYAVDIQQEMLDMLLERAKEKEVSNIETVLGEMKTTNLPKNTLDLIILVDVYHEFSHPAEMLGSMKDSLKDDGLIALLEYRLEDPEVPIKLLHKMSKKQILKEYEANGFELSHEYDGLPWQHMMFFKKKPHQTLLN